MFVTTLHKTNQWWRFRKNLWPSQNIFTLSQLLLNVSTYRLFIFIRYCLSQNISNKIHACFKNTLLWCWSYLQTSNHFPQPFFTYLRKIFDPYIISKFVRTKLMVKFKYAFDLPFFTFWIQWYAKYVLVFYRSLCQRNFFL